MRYLLVLLLLLTSPLHAEAELREWRSSSGTQSFQAEFLAFDGVRATLKRRDGRIVTVALKKLSTGDQAWLKKNATPTRGKGPNKNSPPPSGAAFDQLQFGDDRATVEKKLKASSFVSGDYDETFLGRTGLNGVFKTKSTIGGRHCYLFFDWTAGGGLREVTLQTQPVGKSKYVTSLRGNWAEMISLLNKLHGHPRQAAGFPEASELQDGAILGSHLWYTEEGHSVILGTGQEGNGYAVVVRITSERIRPTGNAPTPKGDPKSGQPSPSDFRR